MLGLILACPPSTAAASDYMAIHELSAIASGSGEPGGLFGLSVAVDGDLAVAASAGSEGGAARLAVIRTYMREGTRWNYLPGHDIALNDRIQPDQSIPRA